MRYTFGGLFFMGGVGTALAVESESEAGFLFSNLLITVPGSLLQLLAFKYPVQSAVTRGHADTLKVWCEYVRERDEFDETLVKIDAALMEKSRQADVKSSNP